MADPREATIVSGRAVFARWCRASGLDPESEATRLDAVAAFAGLDPALGWAGNLRRWRHAKPAVRRPGCMWRYCDLADSDAAWRDAAGACAVRPYAILPPILADHLFRADTRPDDLLTWAGDPEDPWPWAALVIGATVVFTR